MANDLPEVPALDTALPVVPLEPYNVALLIDNTVYEIINTNGQSAARFLSQPKFVQIGLNQCGLGWKYNPDTGEFTQP
jgi:hypothetical protein